jgi:hypothetical protein
MADIPKESEKPIPMPDNLRTVKEIMGERLVIARPSYGVVEKKGFKI